MVHLVTSRIILRVQISGTIVFTFATNARKWYATRQVDN